MTCSGSAPGMAVTAVVLPAEDRIIPLYGPCESNPKWRDRRYEPEIWAGVSPESRHAAT